MKKKKKITFNKDGKPRKIRVKRYPRDSFKSGPGQIGALIMSMKQ